MNGVPRRDLYRQFKLDWVGNDDYRALREVIGRRFKRAEEGGGWERP